MTIDIHAHVWTDTNAQLARAAEAGICVSVLLGTRFHPEDASTLPALRSEFNKLLAGLDGGESTDDAHHTATGELIRALDRHPDSTVGLVGCALNNPADARTTLDAGLRHPRILGIGELTPAGGHADEIVPALEVAADHGGVPVLTHGFLPNNAEDMRTYAALARRFPTVPVIVGAFGGPSSMDLIQAAVDAGNLYLDLSSALQVFMVRAAVDAVPDRCLFGSNSPYGDPVASRATVEAAVRDPHLRHQVMHANAAQLLDL